MRMELPLRRRQTGWESRMMTLSQALAKLLEQAEPVEPIEVSLTEAIGLVLAEPVHGDVDLPPFDRAAGSGYAVRAAGATAGTLLHVTEPWVEGDPHDHEIDSAEAARVEAGDPLPLGADAVLTDLDVRNASTEAPARVIEVLSAVAARQGVKHRGDTLDAGSVLAEAGTRITPALVPLLAAQGCVQPICHRRVRVAIIAVGDHLISPADAPVLHHERNAANLSLASLILGTGAVVHDLGAVSPEAFPRSLDRALNAPVVLVLGRPSKPLRQTLADAGFEPILVGVALEPGHGAEIGFGTVRDDDGRLVAHVFHLPLAPLEAMAAVALLVLPLVARLQGEPEDSSQNRPLSVVWDAPMPATGDSLRAVAATLIAGTDGRLRARPVVSAGPCDLPEFAHATGLALFEANEGPWRGGEVVAFVPFLPWCGRVEG